MSKIGFKVILRMGISIIAIVVAVLVIAVLLFYQVIVTTLKTNAESSVNVLEAQVHTVDEDIKTASLLISVHNEMVEAVKAGDKAKIETLEHQVVTNEAMCVGIYDKDGKQLWTTAKMLASVDVNAALNGTFKDNYVKDSNVDLAFVTGRPIVDGSTTIGAVVVAYDFSSNAIVDQVKAETTAETTIFVDNVRLSTTAIQNGSRVVGTTMDANIASAVLTNRGTYAGDAVVAGNAVMSYYKPLYDMDNNVIGAFFSGYPTATIMGELVKTVVISVIVALVIIVIAFVIIARLMNTAVVRPVQKIVSAADCMVDCRLQDAAAIQLIHSNDEIGQLGDKMHVTFGEMSTYIGEISDVLGTMARGDFTVKITREYKGEFAEIKRAIDAILNNIGSIITNINISSDEVYNGSSQMAAGSQMLADGTTTQASAIQELTSTIADISENTKRNAADTVRANEVITDTERLIEQQNQQTQSMLAAMEEIKSKSAEISNIIKTIDDIAFQTNILALNAAVEAARAGAAGKGFAVVAEEVRNLASKSAEAAKTTTELIESSIAAVANGSEIANATAESLKQVMILSKESQKLIEGINHATNEQAQSIGEVTTGLSQISDVVQQNSATAEQTAASSEELSAQSQNLKDLVSRITVFGLLS